MSKDKLDFEWTVEDVDRAFLNAAMGPVSPQQPNTKPNILKMLKAKNQIDRTRNERQGS